MSCGSSILNYNECKKASDSYFITFPHSKLGKLTHPENWGGPKGCHIQKNKNFQFNENFKGKKSSNHFPICSLNNACAIEKESKPK